MSESQWDEFCKTKIVTPQTLPQFIEKIRHACQTIVTINGSFDLLHSGHIYMLFEAKRQGDILIVGLNSDASIAAYKSCDRPIIPLEERIRILCGIAFVDYITWFEETDPRKMLEVIKPDVHVNGSEYKEDCIEAQTVTSNGGKLYFLDRIRGLSTSKIIEKISSLQLMEK